VLALLAALVLPGMAGTRRGTDLAACVNNLRQIGRAYQVWASEHNDDAPYFLSMAMGGIQQHPLSANAWFQFSWVSNQLVTPRVLACPSDTTRLVARDFGGSADGGFVSTGYRNNAVSYFVSPHGMRFQPGSFLSGDRNVRVGPLSGCSAISGAAYSVRLGSEPRFSWTNNLHGFWGTILTYDGQVRTVSNQTVTNLFPAAIDPSKSDDLTHLVMP
jgi:hypothetical protein